MILTRWRVWQKILYNITLTARSAFGDYVEDTVDAFSVAWLMRQICFFGGNALCNHHLVYIRTNSKCRLRLRPSDHHKVFSGVIVMYELVSWWQTVIRWRWRIDHCNIFRILARPSGDGKSLSAPFITIPSITSIAYMDIVKFNVDNMDDVYTHGYVSGMRVHRWRILLGFSSWARPIARTPCSRPCQFVGSLRRV